METKNTLLDEIKAVLKENLTAVIACIKKEGTKKKRKETKLRLHR
jgi:hypothetical protein